MDTPTYIRAHDHFAPYQSSPFAQFNIFLVLIAALSLAGCLGLTGAGTPAANSHAASTDGTLAVSATSFTFGGVKIGSKSTQTLTLSNTGNAIVKISQANITGAGFSVIGEMSSVSIAAGQQQTFQVQFAPTATGNVTGSIAVASNATNPALAIPLSGIGMSALTIATQPANQIVISKQIATFSVAATGTGTLTYQWQKNGATIGGATAASYTILATTTSDNGAQFTVVVTDSTGSLTSNAATLTVSMLPSITTQPASQTVIAGQMATFSVAAAGTAPFAYQWNNNGAAIIGATSASYTTHATTTSDNGAQFTVTITSSAGNVTSNAATLTVNAATYLLNASQTSLNFSNVNVRGRAVLPVIFTSAGNSSVTISNVSISGAGFTASSVSSGQMVTPGNTSTLDVTFAPAAAGIVTGASVTVTSNATNSPASISLSGTGVQTVTHSASLGWISSTSVVSGYDMFRSTVNGGPYTKLNSALVAGTTYADSTVEAGHTYYYVVTSVDSSGVESVDSNEVSATVP